MKHKRNTLKEVAYTQDCKHSKVPFFLTCMEDYENYIVVEYSQFSALRVVCW